MSSRKIAGIESARILAATVVLVQHGVLRTLSPATTGYRYVSWLGPASGMAVNLFFVISGYVLVPGLLVAHPNPRRFVKRRLRRLVPLYYLVGVFMVGLYLLAYHHVPRYNTLSHFTFTSIYTGHFLVGPGWTLCVEFAFTFLLLPIAFIVRSITRTAKGQALLLGVVGMLGAIAADLAVRFLLSPGRELTVAPIAGLLPLLLGGALALLPIERAVCGRRRLALPALLLLWPVSTQTSVPGAGILLESIASAAALVLLLPTTWKVSSFGRYSYGVYLWQLPLIDLAFFVMFGTLSDTHFPTWSLLPSLLFTCALFAVTVAVSIVTYRWIELPFMEPGDVLTSSTSGST